MSDFTYTGRGLTTEDYILSTTTDTLWELSSTIASATGVGAERVAKLNILHEIGTPFDFSGSIDALFNPNQVTLTRTVNWRRKGASYSQNWSTELRTVASSYQPATLTLDLLFDTSEGTTSLMALAGDMASGGLSGRLSSPSGTNVLAHCSRVSRLALPAQELHRPPVCQIWWGPYKLIQGVLSSCSQKFTHWLPDGTPVRVSLGCTFTEYELNSRMEFHSPDVEKTHIVRRGDTLQAIAAVHFGDPAKWIDIARHNRIDNPRALTVGSALRIPAHKED